MPVTSNMRSSRAVSRRRGRQKGSAIVEGTICLLGFIVLMLGTFELTWAIYAYDYVVNAAIEASHYAFMARV
ncbi:MAG: TadE family protein [Acidobacteriota bacterium]